MRLSPSAVLVLQALAVYHFLSDEHLARLGIGKNAASVRRGAVTQLKQTGRPLIKDIRLTGDEFGSVRKRHYLHYMTGAGKIALIEQCGYDPKDIWIPSRHPTLSVFKYPHRYHYISAHIQIRRWVTEAGGRILWFDHEYQGDTSRPYQRGKPRSRTRIDLPGGEYVISDGYFVADIGGMHFDCILELHNKTCTNFIVEQLLKHTSYRENIVSSLSRFCTKKSNKKLIIFSIHRCDQTYQKLLYTLKKFNSETVSIHVIQLLQFH